MSAQAPGAKSRRPLLLLVALLCFAGAGVTYYLLTREQSSAAETQAQIRAAEIEKSMAEAEAAASKAPPPEAPAPEERAPRGAPTTGG